MWSSNFAQVELSARSVGTQLGHIQLHHVMHLDWMQIARDNRPLDRSSRIESAISLKTHQLTHDIKFPSPFWPTQRHDITSSAISLHHELAHRTFSYRIQPYIVSLVENGYFKYGDVRVGLNKLIEAPQLRASLEKMVVDDRHNSLRNVIHLYRRNPPLSEARSTSERDRDCFYFLCGKIKCEDENYSIARPEDLPLANALASLAAVACRDHQSYRVFTSAKALKEFMLFRPVFDAAHEKFDEIYVSRRDRTDKFALELYHASKGDLAFLRDAVETMYGLISFDQSVCNSGKEWLYHIADLLHVPSVAQRLFRQ